jgi:hypothetical protein
MAQRTVTDEIKFSENELWCAMEMQVRDLVSDRAIQYLTKEAVREHVREGIEYYFGTITRLQIDSDEYDGGEVDIEEVSYSMENFTNCIYMAVQLVLEHVLPEIHLKPEWQTTRTWAEMVQAKKENTNDTTNME